jgi:hypothetical protein
MVMLVDTCKEPVVGAGISSTSGFVNGKCPASALPWSHTGKQSTQ